jgi:endonuclease/exonuclease/phosphatase (EEP) superfamily protein YafD
MDNIIRKLMTIALPALMLFIAASGTGKTGNEAIWYGLRKVGISFGPLPSFGVLIFVGLLANSFSHFAIDDSMIKFYQKRRKLETPENLVVEIDKLPLSKDLKIKLKWSIIHGTYQPISWKFLISIYFAIVIIIVTLLSIGSSLYGEYRLFELASHFKLQYLIFGCCSCIFFAITRAQKWQLLVSIFCIMINLAEIVPWYLPQPAFAEVNPAQLRIFHSNVLTTNEQYANLISLVREEKPDIAVFVEVSTSWVEELKVLKDTFPYSVRYQESQGFGSAIYSKLPLENPAVKAFSQGRKSLLADVKFQGKIVSLLLAHPNIPLKDSSFSDRNQQLAGIGEYAAQVKNPVVVVGDFNTTMWSPFYKSMVKTGGLRNVRSGFGILPTWPTFMPVLYIPIDHLLVSKEIGVLKVHTGRNVGSDHLPLITDLLIPGTRDSSD